MRHRKLRIAWSVGWGLVAVLLCVFWVRSYLWLEQLILPISSNVAIGVGVMPGSSVIAINPKWGWPHVTRHSQSVDGWLGRVGWPHSRLWGLFQIRATGAVIPFWFSLVVVAALASIVWIRHLPWRFSLRTLLIATTLVAVVLGLWVWAVRG